MMFHFDDFKIWQPYMRRLVFRSYLTSIESKWIVYKYYLHYLQQLTILVT